MQERLLSPREVAEHLGISVDGVYRLAHRKDGIKGCKVGGVIRFRPSDVEAYITSTEIKPPERHTPLPDMKRFQYKPGMKVVSL